MDNEEYEDPYRTLNLIESDDLGCVEEYDITELGPGSPCWDLPGMEWWQEKYFEVREDLLHEQFDEPCETSSERTCRLVQELGELRAERKAAGLED